MRGFGNVTAEAEHKELKYQRSIKPATGRFYCNYMENKRKKVRGITANLDFLVGHQGLEPRTN